MKKLLGAFAIVILNTWSALADDMKTLPLSPPSALLDTNDRQAATTETFGQITIQEISLARKIAAEDSSIEAVKQHAKVFNFYFVPLKFGVLGFDGKKCAWLQLGATLKTSGADSQQIFILNVFPATSLKPGNAQGAAKIVVSSDLKVTTPDASPVGGTVSVGGSANVDWKWSPLYQQAGAVFDQTRVVWRFEAVGSEFPVGELDVGAIIAVAKTQPLPRLGLDMEMRASFGGGWFDPGGIARANATVLVPLP
jgi:hypothetical protein